MEVMKPTNAPNAIANAPIAIDGMEGSVERGKASRQTPLKVRSQLETRIARIEREIEDAIDARKAEIEALFTQVELYEDRARVKDLEEEMDALRRAQMPAGAEWESLLRDYENV